jgi:hypothetical protein
MAMTRSPRFFLPLLLLTFTLSTRCRPAATTTEAATTPPVEAPAKTPAKTPEKTPTPDTTPMTPPTEAVKKTAPEPPVKEPEPVVVSHPAVTLKKLGSLTQPVRSLALHPECKAVLAGAKNWELARLGADGKTVWTTRTAPVRCPAGNRCSEFPRALFLPNDHVVAMMDGDSLRMFSPRGKMMALRGGFLQHVLDFRVSVDGKLVGALYPHGLALWRTSGGLLRKVEIPGAAAFDFAFTTNCEGKPEKHVLVSVDDRVLEFGLELAGSRELWKLDGPVVDFHATAFLTAKTRYETFGGVPPAPESTGLLTDTRPLRVLPSRPHWVLAVREGKYALLRRQPASKVAVVPLEGVTPGADPVTAVNGKCVAIASGNEVWFARLPDSLP